MNVEILQPTGFPLDLDDPLAPSHRRLHEYLQRLPDFALKGIGKSEMDWTTICEARRASAAQILALPLGEQLDCIRASARFSDWSRFEWGWSSLKPQETEQQVGFESALDFLCVVILDDSQLEGRSRWSDEQLRELVALPFPYPFERVTWVTQVFLTYLAHHPLGDELRETVQTVREWNASVVRLASWITLGLMMGDRLVLQSGEPWADEARGWIAQLPDWQFEPWRGVLHFCALQSAKSKPSATGLRAFVRNIEALGENTFARCFVDWSKKWGQQPRHEINDAVWKGLVWHACLVKSPEVAASLGQIARIAAQKGEPNPFKGGHRVASPPIFNACVWSLNEHKTDAARREIDALWREIEPRSLRQTLAKVLKP